MERKELVQGEAGCSSSIKPLTGVLQCQIELSFFEMESLRSRECRQIALKAFGGEGTQCFVFIFISSIKLYFKDEQPTRRGCRKMLPVLSQRLFLKSAVNLAVLALAVTNKFTNASQILKTLFKSRNRCQTECYKVSFFRVCPCVFFSLDSRLRVCYDIFSFLQKDPF